MTEEQRDRLREGLGDEIYFTLNPTTPELRAELEERIATVKAQYERLLRLRETLK